MTKKAKKSFVRRLDDLRKQMFAVADFSNEYPDISDKLYEMAMKADEMSETVEIDIENGV